MLLLKDDIEALAEGRRSSPEAIRAEYCQINTELSERAGTVVFELRSIDGRCAFLTEENRCSVHAYKPTQCQMAPDRFLPNAMKSDYECMHNVDIDLADDMTERFFLRLMENTNG